MKLPRHLCVPALLVVSALVSGCAQSEGEFSTSERTRSLMREAQGPVVQTLKENFGEPHHLVAWLKLTAVDFGQYTGEVVEAEENADRFKVRFISAEPAGGAQDQASEQTINPDDLRGSALMWLTGEYSKISLAGDGEQPGVHFMVREFQPATEQLVINARLAVPPAVGDRFLLVGHDLQHGQKLYAEHCLHCHGMAGDGNGPTAKYLNPKPRDYRLGIFKFTSTAQNEKASREDLKSIIKYGVPGTYMPSFLMLADEDVDRIVEFIRWLAIRGEIEKRLNDELQYDYSESAVAETIANAYDQPRQAEDFRQQLAAAEEEYNQRVAAWQQSGGAEASRPSKPDILKSRSELREDIVARFAAFLEEDYPDLVEETADFVNGGWERAEADASVIIPKTGRVPDTEESRRRGRELYLSDRTKCATCHGPEGKGNGTATKDYWPIKGSNEKYPNPGLHDDWGNPLPPRDLTTGIYRGGRRPVDLYRRLYAGIKGTPMPAFSTALTDEQIWDIVNYVLSIPFEGRPSGPSESAEPPVRHADQRATSPAHPETAAVHIESP